MRLVVPVATDLALVALSHHRTVPGLRFLHKASWCFCTAPYDCDLINYQNKRIFLAHLLA